MSMSFVHPEPRTYPPPGAKASSAAAAIALAAAIAGSALVAGIATGSATRPPAEAPEPVTVTTHAPETTPPITTTDERQGGDLRFPLEAN